MTPDEATALRKPFPADVIGKLPRITCKACSNAPSRNCDKHKKHDCKVCGNWISEKHIHLDYIGHAGVTDRLLEVDREWTWKPVAIDSSTCAPVCTDGGLWIAMTVCGVTRLGWGDGPDIKQRISDAIRNAAMRFGVGLDLWSKEDLGHDTENAEGAGSGQASPVNDAPTSGSPPGTVTAAARAEAQPSATSPARRQNLKSRCSALVADGVSVADERAERGLPKIDDCDELQLDAWGTMVSELEAELAAPFEKADA